MMTDDKDLTPDMTTDPTGDPELDAVLAATGVGLLVAIRRSLDLDGGLTQIVGSPPKEVSPQLSATGMSQSPEQARLRVDRNPVRKPPLKTPPATPSDIGGQIAQLRFLILDTAESFPAQSTVNALLRSASATLKELNRGLEARELTRDDAQALLTDTGLALESAIDVWKRELLAQPYKNKFLRPSLRRLLIPLIPMVWVGFFIPLESMHISFIVATLIAGGAIMALLLIAWVVFVVTRAVSLSARSRQSKIRMKMTDYRRLQTLQRTLKILRPGILRLFDDADDCSPQCVPLF